MNCWKSNRNSRNSSPPSNSSSSKKRNKASYDDDIPCSKPLFTRALNDSAIDRNSKCSIDDSLESKNNSDNSINNTLPGSTSSFSASIISMAEKKESPISSPGKVVAQFLKSLSKDDSNTNSSIHSLKSSKCGSNCSNQRLHSSSSSKSKTITNINYHMAQSANQINGQSLKSSSSENDGIHSTHKSIRSRKSTSQESNASLHSHSSSSSRTTDSINQESNVVSQKNDRLNDNVIESNNQKDSQFQQSLSMENEGIESTENSFKSRENSSTGKSSSHHSTSSSNSGTRNSTNGDVVLNPNCVVSQSLISAPNDDNSLQFPLELGKRMSKDSTSSLHNTSSSSGNSTTSMQNYINHDIALTTDQIHTDSPNKDNVIIVTDQTLESWENVESNLITILPCTTTSSSTSNQIVNTMRDKDVHNSNEIGSLSFKSASSDIVQYHTAPASSNDFSTRPASMNELMKFESAEDFILQTESFSSIENVSGKKRGFPNLLFRVVFLRKNWLLLFLNKNFFFSDETDNVQPANQSSSSSEDAKENSHQLRIWSPLSSPVNFRNFFEQTVRRYWTYVARLRFHNSTPGSPGINRRFWPARSEEETNTSTRKL